MKFNSLGASTKQEITEVLSRFGLKDTEQHVYLTLLELGSVGITTLAHRAKLAPTTTESVVQRLYQSGLVIASKHKSRHIYQACAPDKLKQQAEDRVREITRIAPFLNELISTHTRDAKVTVYYREQLTDIFDTALTAKSKLVYEIVAAAPLQAILGERYHFTKRRVEKHVRLKSLRVESKEIKKYSPAAHARELREAKFLPRELSFSGSILLWDTSVAFFSTKEEGVAVLITSPAITDMVRQIFDLLWSVSRTMITA